MRINYLSLPAFGIFVDKTIRFASDRGLHVIYGPNEAGKSTILAAVSDALFGIPRSSPHAFFHKASALRIIMHLAFSDGTELGFIRRRGLRKTLLDLEENPLPDDVLAPYLAGLDRADFEDMFGLDHLRLREGGKRLLESGGEFSQSLFEAASGMRRLREVFQEMDGEARTLFLPQGKNPPVNSLTTEYRASRQAVDEAVLAVHVFQELEEKYNREREAQQQLMHAVKEVRGQLAKLERIERTKPLLSRRKACLEELHGLGALPMLPGDSTARFQLLAGDLNRLGQEREQTERELSLLQEQLEVLHIPHRLLQQEGAITELVQDVGKYGEAIEELPKLEQQIELEEQRALTQLKAIHPAVKDLSEAEVYRLPLSAKIRLEELAGRAEVVGRNMDKAQEAVDVRTAELRRTERALADFGPIRDITALQRLVLKISALGDLERQYEGKLAEIEQQEEQLKGECERLPLWQGTLAQLAQAELPLASTVTRFIQEHNELQEEKRSLLKDIGELQQRSGSLQHQKEMLSVQGTVPSEEELLAARERRDYGWQLVRKSWLHNQPDKEGERTFSAHKALPEAYEESVAYADHIADELRRESDRVAQLQTLEVQLEHTARSLEAKHKQYQAVVEKERVFAESWRGIWSRVGIEPQSPQEMEEWLRTAKALIEDYEVLQNERSAADKLAEQVTASEVALREALHSVGETAEGRLSELLERAREICAVEEKRKGKYEGLMETVARETEALAKAQEVLRSAQAEQERWAKDWAAAVAEIGLPVDTSVNATQKYVRALDEAFDLLDHVQEIRQTKEHKAKFAAQYKARVEKAAAHSGLDVKLESISHAVRELWEQVQKARDQRTRKEELLKQIEAKQQHLAELKGAAAQAEKALEQLMAAAKCSTREQLEAVLRRCSRGEELRKEIAQLEELLLKNGDGLSLPELEAEAAAVVADSIPGEVEALKRKLEELEKSLDEVTRALGATEKEYNERVEGNSAAAVEAAERAHETLARLAAKVEEYVRLRLASLILRRAVDRYREENQDPVLQRAGEIFRKLTGGRFTHLTADYDDKDSLVIKGVRGGELVGLEGMSDGTQDQLYLALRLASIERYLQEKEAIPFIVDDVLINFDDYRAAAALRVLAELAEQTQVIMFTHHLSIVQLVQKELPHDSFALYFLDNKQDTQPLSPQELESVLG